MLRFLITVAFVGAALTAASLPSQADPVVVELLPARDNTLFETALGDTSSGAGIGLFSGRIRQQHLRRAVLAFDFTGALPEGAVVDSVRLELNVVNTQDPFVRVMRLHRMTVDWGEGASAAAGGQGTDAEPGDATWLHNFYPSTFWTLPGGDYDFTPSSATSVGSLGRYSWTSEVMRDEVRAWISGTLTHHGWILIGEESVNQTARLFDSRESTQAANRPRLLIYYDTDTPVLESSWGRLRARYR